MKTSSTIQGSGISETIPVKLVNLARVMAAIFCLQSSAELAAGAAPATAATTKPAAVELVKKSVTTQPVKKLATAQPAKQVSSGRRKMMVPPPPPEIQMGGQQSSMEFSTIGVPLDFMGRADLVRMKERLAQNLAQTTKKADERKREIAEGKTRLAQFESFFKDGIVSKKEVNGAKKELEAAQDTDVDIDQRLDDLKSDLARIEKRLKFLDKQSPKPALAVKAGPKPAAAAKPAKFAAGGAAATTASPAQVSAKKTSSK